MAATRKLTPAQDVEIYRKKSADPAPSNKALADEYGVDESAISRAVQRGRKAVEGAELSTAAPAPAPAIIATAPHNRIAPSPLNPRKRFDPEATERMVETVREEGILIPLLVRRANQPGNTPVGADVDYEIIGGERRWRAAETLVNAGEWLADRDTPIRVVELCDDRKYLKLALAENIARKDMTPWEEAEAFDRLRLAGDSAAEIAKAVGMNKRTVEMRLRLVRDLADPAKEALREGKLTVEAANILAAFCAKLSQKLALEEIAAGRFRTTSDLKRYLTQALVSTSVAFFPLSDYSGEMIVDETDPDTTYFSDSKQFERLQQKAIAEAEIKAKARGYAWTKVVDSRKSGEFFASWDYETNAKDKSRGVVYEIKQNGMVVVHTDLVSKADKTKQAAAASGVLGAVESSPITKAHFAHARRRKTVALQSALAGAPMVAMRALCLALIGCGENIRIRTEHQGADDKVDSPEVVATIETYLGRFAHTGKDGFEVSGGDVRRKGWGMPDDGAAWDVLAAMTDDEVVEFFAALTALRVGSFATYSPEAGDRPAVVGMARSLGLIGAEAKHGLALQREDLEGLRKPALLDVRRQVCPDDFVSDLNLTGLKDHLMVADKDYVLPTLRFGDKATVEALFKSSAAALAKASAPSGELEVDLAMLRRVLSAHSIFAAKATLSTPLADVVGEEDFDRVAADIASAFGVSTITADVLHTAEDLGNLALIIEAHAAALQAEGRAA